MNRKRQLLREFFLNAVTIALVKQVIVSGAQDRALVKRSAASEDEPSAEVPPYFLG